MAYISGRCHRQRQKPIQIMFANNLVETVSNFIVRWLFYICILSLLFNTNCDVTVVRASYAVEVDDLLNQLDRPSKCNRISFVYFCFVFKCKLDAICIIHFYLYWQTKTNVFSYDKKNC